MLENGIAEPSSSAWSSLCVLSIKSDESDRLCTDYPKVSNITKPDCLPLPRVDDWPLFFYQKEVAQQDELMSHLMKMLERLLLSLIRQQVQHAQDPLQFACRPEVGVEDAALHILHRAHMHLDTSGGTV